MLFGEYDHQVDAKNRIRIPARFKNEIGNNYVFMKGPSKCISVYPLSVFENRFGKFLEVSVFDSDGQKALAEVFASCFNAVEDGQGRAVIPEKLRAYAGIDKDIVSIGMGDHIDIYSINERNALKEGTSYLDMLSILKSKIE